MPFDFAVCSRNNIKTAAARLNATHLISVIERGTTIYRPSRIAPENHLLLHCEDVADEVNPAAPDRKLVNRLLEFGARLEKHDRPLFHCEAGVSRSTAAALVLLRQHMGSGSAEAAGDLLKRVRPEAAPNRLIVKHGAETLGDPELVAVGLRLAMNRIRLSTAPASALTLA